MLGKINDYNQLGLIEKGGFGDVYLVESVDKHQYALKLIPVIKGNKQDLRKQAQMYVKLQHPNILKAREYFYYNQERFMAIVLEYCPDGTLVNLIGKINQNEIKKIMTQIVQGLTQIHKHKIIHRDIKPQNILMMNGEPKITDFGLAQIMKTSGISGKSGTLFYEAPQVLHEEKYSQAADIWSLGILFLELLLGQRIFKLLKGTLPPGIREGFPFQNLFDKIKNEEFKDIVSRMLMKKPQQRLSLKDLFNYLNGKKKQETQIKTKQSFLSSLPLQVNREIKIEEPRLLFIEENTRYDEKKTLIKKIHNSNKQKQKQLILLRNFDENKKQEIKKQKRMYPKGFFNCSGPYSCINTAHWEIHGERFCDIQCYSVFHDQEQWKPENLTYHELIWQF